MDAHNSSNSDTEDNPTILIEWTAAGGGDEETAQSIRRPKTRSGPGLENNKAKVRGAGCHETWQG